MPSPENFGKQFEDIIGNNFSNSEAKDMAAKAHAEHLFGQVEGIMGSYRGAVENEANQRMGLFPEHMMSIDEDGRHVRHTSVDGWTHTWHGGQYIEHIHPKHGAVEVTNVGNSKGELPIMTPNEFLDHAASAEKEFNDNYDPRDWR